MRTILVGLVMGLVACSGGEKPAPKPKPETDEPVVVDKTPEPEPEPIRRDWPTQRPTNAPAPGAADLLTEPRRDVTFDLERAVAKKVEGNLVVSPAAVQLGLGLVLAGTTGATEKELRKALRVPSGDVQAADASLLAAWNHENAPYELGLANRLWGRSDHTFEQAFADTASGRYAAPVEGLDVADAAGATAAVNEWVHQHTHEQVSGLIGEGAIRGDTQLVLANAAYFRGRWDQAFDANKTADGTFTKADGTEIQVPFMSQISQMKYGEKGGIKVLEMRYQGARMAMAIVMPDDPAGLPAIEKDLSSNKLAEYMTVVRPRRVDARIPKFSVRTRVQMADLVNALGAPRLTSNKAELGGIAKGRLMLSAGVHEAVVVVDEKGATADASGAQAATTQKPIPFSADRPFVFVILDTVSGVPLFVGRITDPSS